MSNAVDFDYLHPLFEEVDEIFSAPTLLNGCQDNISISINCDSYAYTCKIIPYNEFLKIIDSRNDITPFTELEDRWIDFALGLYVTIGNYMSSLDKDQISQWATKIINNPSKKAQVDNLAKQIAEKYSMDEDKSLQLLNHFQATISRHIAATIERRAILMSKRFIPLELLLAAYRHGLYPCGWVSDDDILLCLNPYNE